VAKTHRVPSVAGHFPHKTVGRFCRKCPIKIRHSMTLRHPVCIYVSMYGTYTCVCDVCMYVCMDVYLRVYFICVFVRRIGMYVCMQM